MDMVNTTNTIASISDTLPDLPLTNIKLPSQWVLYLYDKQLFKKMANKPDFRAVPHKEQCTINTLNDLIYILKLMEVKCDIKNKSKINLDANNYIIMRKGIEPIWEDPKNSEGGTFTIKMDHSKGYEIWSSFVMHILGETLTEEMQDINGISVSYITDNFNNPASNNSYTFIKIWDGKPSRTQEQFVKILSPKIVDAIKADPLTTLAYLPHNAKKDYGGTNIMAKLKKNAARGGFRKVGEFRSRKGNQGHQGNLRY